MKVAVVGPTPPPVNGMTVMIEAVLRASELDIAHVDTSDHRDIGRVGRLDIKNIVLAFAHAFRLARVLWRNDVDLVYIPIAQNRLGFARDALLISIARAFRSRIVVHLHGGHFDIFYGAEPRVVRWAIRRVFSWVDAGIVLGESLRHCLEVVLPQEAVYVVPNGIRDLSTIPTSAPFGRDVLIHISSLSESKGSLLVLEAFAEIADEIGWATLVLAGPWVNPSDRVKAEAFMRERRLMSRVIMPGLVDESQKAILLARSRLFLMPTRFRYEGQPVVIIEAMRSGVPVIATHHGCIAETVVNGLSGLIMSSCSSACLAESILEVCQDDEYWTQLSLGARQQYEERFTEAAFHTALVSALSGVKT